MSGKGRGVPPPPAHLTPAQAEAYREVAAAVGPSASAVQLRQLEAYAVERARWLECEAFVAENGMVLVLRNDKGEVRAVQEAPQLKIGQRAREAAIKLGAQLGLT